MALPTIEQVLASPCTHNWLKSALQSALNKDIVDVTHDADLLAKLLRARCDAVLGLPEVPAIRYQRNVYSRREHRSA